MAKVATLSIMIALLLSFMLAYAARPEPAFYGESLGAEAAQKEEDAEGSCEGVGEEECLIRRTLAAHLDYIYTQKQKP